jgi:DNA-binding NtrC family response regulator
MEDEKTVLNEVASGAYDASDMPFDFVEEGTETALICEPDPQIREKITGAMQTMGYLTTEAQNARDALKKTRFHVYHVVALNELFDTANPDANDLLAYFGSLPTATRRQTFVILITERFRTMDNMAAFNKSVDLIINLKNVDDYPTILKKGLNDHRAFYQIFKETLRKMGKI